jgi:hypothetical protein
VPSNAHAPDRCTSFLASGCHGNECGKPLAVGDKHGAKLTVPDDQTVGQPDDTLRCPVHLDNPSVAIGDDYPASELIERAQRDARFPTQIVQLRYRSNRTSGAI